MSALHTRSGDTYFVIDLLRLMRHASPAIFKYENILGHDEIVFATKGRYEDNYEED